MRRYLLKSLAALALPAALASACDEYEPKVLPHGQGAVATTPTTTPTSATSAPDATTSSDVAVDTGPAPIDPIGVDLGGDHPVVIVTPPPAPQPPTRPRRRMDIDQLDRAILQATGYAWTQTVSGREVNQFQALAQTLGRPDYIETTQEDLSPSTLFQKFLDEAARTVCDRLATAEAATFAGDDAPDTAALVLFRHARPNDRWDTAPDAIEKNLSHLLLRFHGAKIAATDPAMEPWRWLFRSALHVSSDPVIAWRTVCVGLIVHPAFYTY